MDSREESRHSHYHITHDKKSCQSSIFYQTDVFVHQWYPSPPPPSCPPPGFLLMTHLGAGSETCRVSVVLGLTSYSVCGISQASTVVTQSRALDTQARLGSKTVDLSQPLSNTRLFSLSILLHLLTHSHPVFLNSLILFLLSFFCG